MDSSHERTSDTSFLQLPGDVRRSTDLLSEAVRPTGRQMSLRHVEYTPSSVASRSLFDISDSVGMFAPSSNLPTPSMRATSGNSTLYDSLLTNPRLQPFDNDVKSTTANITLLAAENPDFMTCHGVFADFAESFSSASAQRELFAPLSRYEQICRENVDLLQRVLSRSVPTHASSINIDELLFELQQEQQTWQLVSALYKDRLDTQSHSDINDVTMADSQVLKGSSLSEKKSVGLLFERDAELRQAQMVVDWLELIAASELDSYYHKVDFSSDRMGAWENTLHMLKQQKAVGTYSAAARTIVDRLDPDAPVRQGRQLLDLDVDDDMQLLNYMFACVRAGQVEEAQRACDKMGQNWRGATLNGWRLYHDPNLESLGPAGSTLKIEGNPYRDMWKDVCWRLAEDERYPQVERAVYAALCAHLRHLLPFLHNWRDYLWAYFRAMVDQKVENHIRSTLPAPPPRRGQEHVPLPQSYLQETFTAKRIFDEIQSCHDDKVRAECSNRFFVIQKHVITDSVDDLIQEMYKWCSDRASPPSSQQLRFMSHLVLFFRALGITAKEALCDGVVEAYVDYLINNKEINLVAIYVATLPSTQQIELYARLLKGVHETDERRQCLDLGERYGLKIQSITKLVVETVGSASSVNFTTNTTDPHISTATTDDDLTRIDSLEWLIFRNEQRPEALRQANTMMRSFLGSHKLQACRLASRKIPSDSLELIKRLWMDKAGDADLPPEDENAVREYLCINAYLDAQESFNDWFEHYHNAKPKLPNMPHVATFSDHVAYEHRERQYNQELDRWQHSLDLQTKSTVDKIYNVLLFVDGGWMTDVRTDGAADECRRRQMLLLRRLCIPPLSMVLHQVLHTTEQYKKAVQIVDCIADEHHQLYQVFTREEIEKLLKKIRESSLKLLEAGLDPLGYPLERS